MIAEHEVKNDKQVKHLENEENLSTYWQLFIGAIRRLLPGKILRFKNKHHF